MATIVRTTVDANTHERKASLAFDSPMQEQEMVPVAKSFIHCNFEFD
jgi:hypothetical protein